MNEILQIKNVHGFLDKKTGTAWLNAGDVARGFGFTKLETKNGVKYESVRWARVNEYLRSFGFRPNVGEDDFLPENMVYRLGFKASNETAQKFQAILADEVLPAIRKHGGYLTKEKMEEALLNPDVLIKLATQLKSERDARKQAEQLIESQKPKVIFAEAVSTSKDGILVGMLAKLLHQNGVKIGQNRLFQWLRDKGYLMKRGVDKNMPTQRSKELGLFDVKESVVGNPDGSIRLTRTPVVTGKGQIYFINLFLKRRERNEDLRSDVHIRR